MNRRDRQAARRAVHAARLDVRRAKGAPLLSGIRRAAKLERRKARRVALKRTSVSS